MTACHYFSAPQRDVSVLPIEVRVSGHNHLKKQVPRAQGGEGRDCVCFSAGSHHYASGGSARFEYHTSRQPWFPDLVSLLDGPPWEIPLRRDLLSPGGKAVLHPHPELWKLHLWPLKGPG